MNNSELSSWEVETKRTEGRRDTRASQNKAIATGMPKQAKSHANGNKIQERKIGGGSKTGRRTNAEQARASTQ